jgi:hypothetical protein
MAQTLIKAATTTDTPRAATWPHVAPRLGPALLSRNVTTVAPPPRWSFISVIALTGADASAPPTPSKAPVTKVGITVPTLAVRGRERLRPWVARPPKRGARGRIADGGGPEPHLGTHTRRSAAYDSGRRTEVCKTVGFAFGGSNPPPATTCGNGPLAADLRLCGPFLLRLAMCHLVALWTAVLRCPRTYSGRRPVGRTVGVTVAFPRTATDAGRGHGRATDRVPPALVSQDAYRRRSELG